MEGRLTESEWRRIAEFAETPKHQRCPEQLLPDGARESVSSSETGEGGQRDQ